MEITINNARRLADIQSDFQNEYPFLKIEFYSKKHGAGAGSNKESTLDANLTIGEVSKKDASGSISIFNDTKVSDLEEAFADTFGLFVQVFRKSNKLWLQTTITDDWSLEKQNATAKEMNTPIIDDSEPSDIREQE